MKNSLGIKRLKCSKTDIEVYDNCVTICEQSYSWRARKPHECGSSLHHSPLRVQKVECIELLIVRAEAVLSIPGS